MLILTSEIIEIMDDHQRDKGSDSDISGEESEIIQDKIDDQITKTFFGSKVNTEEKEALLKELQTKGYKGLVLRLQY